MTYVPADNLWPTPPNLSGGRLLHDFNLWPTIHMFMFCSGGCHAYPAKRPPACQRQRSPRPAPLEGASHVDQDRTRLARIGPTQNPRRGSRALEAHGCWSASQRLARLLAWDVTAPRDGIADRR